MHARPHTRPKDPLRAQIQRLIRVYNINIYVTLLFLGVLIYVGMVAVIAILYVNVVNLHHEVALLSTELRFAKGDIIIQTLNSAPSPAKFIAHYNLNGIFPPEITPTNIAIFRYPNGSHLVLTRVNKGPERNPEDMPNLRGTFWVSRIWQAVLDSNMRLVNKPSALPLANEDGGFLDKWYWMGVEDPRFFLGPRGVWYVSYGGNSRVYDQERVLWIAPVDDILHGREVLFSVGQKWEKNWGFFAYNNELYATYSLNPHIILKVNEKTTEAKVMYETPAKGLQEFFQELFHPFIDTHFGLGTPPIRVRRKDGTYCFLAMFHIKWKAHDRKGQYKNIVYTFEAQPPFQITEISRAPFVPPCTGGHEIVFVSSIMLLPDDGTEQKVLIGYGVEDEEIHSVVTTVDFLLKDLEEMSSYALCSVS